MHPLPRNEHVNGKDQTALINFRSLGVGNRPTVRIGGPDDEGEVNRLLLLGQAENALFPADFLRSSQYVKRFLWAAYLDPRDTGPRGVIGVIGQRGSLQAICMVGIGRLWYAHPWHLEEMIVYVDPDCRHPKPGEPTGHASALIEWMKQQSEVTGMPILTGILSKERTEAKCRLYRRQLTKIGEFFVYFPKGQEWYTDSFMRSVQLSSAA